MEIHVSNLKGIIFGNIVDKIHKAVVNYAPSGDYVCSVATAKNFPVSNTQMLLIEDTSKVYKLPAYHGNWH